MLRKLLVYILIMVFVLPQAALAQGPEATVLDKTTAVEQLLYGAEQTGSLADRVGKVEQDLFGTRTNDALVAKVDRTYTCLRESTPDAPSFVLKLNAVEWSLSHTVTAQPVKTRLENLERMLLGSPVTGSFESRLTKLMNLAFSGGQVETAAAAVAKDSLVKIKIVSPLDTRQSRVGDAVTFEVAEDVYVDGLLVFGRGAQGLGKVSKIEAAQNFGRDAKLEVSFDSLQAMDGQTVATFLGEKAKEETKSLATAAGATVAGVILLGPIGLVSGAFVHGKDVTIPAGTELYIQTKEDVQVYGVKVK